MKYFYFSELLERTTFTKLYCELFCTYPDNFKKELKKEFKKAKKPNINENNIHYNFFKNL